MLELTSEGRITTWSLEQLGQAMGSPAAEASMEDFSREISVGMKKKKKKKEQLCYNKVSLFSPPPANLKPSLSKQMIDKLRLEQFVEQFRSESDPTQFPTANQ